MMSPPLATLPETSARILGKAFSVVKAHWAKSLRIPGCWGRTWNMSRLEGSTRLAGLPFAGSPGHGRLGTRGVQLSHGGRWAPSADPVLSDPRGLRGGAAGRLGDRPGGATQPSRRPVQADRTAIVG